ncbi:hypothetical protein ABZT03_01580 [Streptomyces sp. NPDC005574]|uniref:hypothetical protein n=1 Tax=Streptomyces sp. NPDC005574 TaxID=3156891 RepID=UPI0033A45D62
MYTLFSPEPAAAHEVRRAERPETTTPAAAAPGPLACFLRFTVLGGGVGVLSSGAVAVLAGLLPWAVANALVTVASTLLCTELHARFTFGTGGRAGRRRHWQSAGSAAVAYAVTCAAMLVLHLVRPSPGTAAEQFVYLGAAGLAGLGRFLVLRLVVFATGRTRATTTATLAHVGERPYTLGRARRTPRETRAPLTAWARRTAAAFGRSHPASPWTASPAASG